jgi:tetratricopeptide (TPR) repeat protein
VIRPSRPLFALSLGLAAAAGCAGSRGDARSVPAGAAKWYERARASYRAADVDDARDAAKSALAAAPDSPPVKLMAARVHLARLEYAETLRLLQGDDTSEARGLRGRALWYSGDVDAAADELEALLGDAAVKDEWAKQIALLARRGAGRKPFQVEGGLLANTPMGPVRGPNFVVPLEIDGEQALALVATDKGEVVLDSAARREPSWVQLRFAERITVSNVPALTEDLSGVSKEMGAPIKALLGVNLLRRLNVTFDLVGQQFVVRTREAPAPPHATRVGVAYALGGAMVTRAAFGAQSEAAAAPVLVNTRQVYPLQLDEKGWQIAGVPPGELKPLAGAVNDKGAKLPALKLGAYSIPGVPGYAGASLGPVRNALGVDVVGSVGSGLLAFFRCTMTDGGRSLWIEELPDLAPPTPMPAPETGSAPPGRGAPAAPPGNAPPRPGPRSP